MAPDERPTGTVTFVFSDIEGSTQRWERYPVTMRAALQAHGEIVRSALVEHGGFVFKTIGDPFCAAFARPPCADTRTMPGDLLSADEHSVMTATEQLAIWAAAPNDEVFVWMQHTKNEDIFFNHGFGDMPDQVGRMRARDVLAAFQRTPNATNRIAKDVLARFQNIPDGGNSIRADEIKGIACVIVEGTAPGSPRSPYRVLVSSVGSFT